MSDGNEAAASELRHAGSVRFQVLDVRIDLTVSDPRLTGAVAAVIPDGAQLAGLERPADALLRLTPHGPGRQSVILDGFLLHRALPSDVAVDLLGATIGDAIAGEAPDHLVVRGAAVTVENRAALLVGESFSGATTLAAALVARGAAPLSDRWCALDPAGRAVPVDGRPGAGHEVAAIVHAPYVPGAETRLRPAPSVAAAMTVMSQAPAARRRPAAAMATARHASASAQSLEGIRGEASDCAEILWSLLAEP